MTAPTATASAPRKRKDPKKKNKELSARKEQASARRHEKDPKLARKLRTPIQPKKQNKREDATRRERANGKGRNHPDEQRSNQQLTPSDASEFVGERSAVEPAASRAQQIQPNRQMSAGGERAHGDQERSASSHEPQQRRQLKQALDEPMRAKRTGLRSAYPSTLHLVQAMAVAPWRFWARAMAEYQRAWIFPTHGK